MQTLIRRGAALLVACQCLALAAIALLEWETVDLCFSLDPGEDPPCPPPASGLERLVAAGPFLIYLFWLAIGTAALWSDQPASRLWRRGRQALLCIVALANLRASYLFAMSRYWSTLETVVLIPGCLAIAAVSVLVATGRLRSEPPEAEA